MTILNNLAFSVLVLTGAYCLMTLASSVRKDREKNAWARRAVLLIIGTVTVMVGAIGLEGGLTSEMITVGAVAVTGASLLHWHVMRRGSAAR